MPTITIIDPDGLEHRLDAESGVSVMTVARRHAVSGIQAICGGACVCATCHVHVDPAWMAAAGPAIGEEAEMLDFAADRRPGSRLSCQLRMVPTLDGLILRVPAAPR